MFALSKHTSFRIPPEAKAGDVFLKPGTFRTKGRSYSTDNGILIVPENRNKPGSRLIALPVKRIHAASEHPAEPIFYLSGGPGSSNMKFSPSDSLLANHDVVLVGYRGADGSVVLDCPEIGRAMTGLDGDLASDAALEQIAEAMRSSARRLEAEGVDLAGYTLPEVVGDMEAARLKLGYEGIHLLSESYGTRLAQVYAYQHPKSLSRVVMIGVNPPGRFVWEPQTIDDQLQYYAALWAKDPVYSQRTPDLYASLRRVARAMPKRWLGMPISPMKVKAMAFLLLFHRSTAPLVFDAFLAAGRGDASGLALMSLVYDLMMPKAFIFGDLLAKGGSADFDPHRDYVADLRDADTALGSPASLVIWGPASKGWPIAPIPPELRRVQPSEVETLLVNGSIDFSTPVQFGRDDLLPSLRRGRLVVLSEMGHVGDFWQVKPEASEQLLTSYYDTGIADDSLFVVTPMDFSVKLGFPKIMKRTLGLAGVLVMILAWWGRITLRRRR